MTNKTISEGELRPVAFIAKNKQRVKQFDNKVYLKSNDEFQIEIYNPTRDKVLARIKLNGKNISDSGMVVRPGERIFLDRYLDENKKFKFETYSVNGGSKQSLAAIELNGEVSVQFYKEKETYFPSIYTTYTYNSTTGSKYSPGIAFCTSDLNPVNPNTITCSGNLTCTSSSISVNGNVGLANNNPSIVLCATDNIGIGNDCPSNLLNITNKEKETGRIEKGGKSDQIFADDNSDFDIFPTWLSIWKILPESEKNKTVDDLTIYCPNCGRKRKGGINSKENYCPSCGYKF